MDIIKRYKNKRDKKNESVTINYSKDLIDTLKKYKSSGNNDIIVGKNIISITLDNWSFSADEFKIEVINFLNKEGFDCIDTKKQIGIYPILNIFGDLFRLEKRMCTPGHGLIPCQLAVLIPLNN